MVSLTGKSKPGRFIPQCKADGSFEEVQCHSSTGYCWCVDTEGWELPGTKIRGTPDCKKGTNITDFENLFFAGRRVFLFC